MSNTVLNLRNGVTLRLVVTYNDTALFGVIEDITVVMEPVTPFDQLSNKDKNKAISFVKHYSPWHPLSKPQVVEMYFK